MKNKIHLFLSCVVVVAVYIPIVLVSIYELLSQNKKKWGNMLRQFNK